MNDHDGLTRAALQPFIDRYAGARPDLATPEGARRRCTAESAGFLDFLIAEGAIDRADRIELWEVLEIDVIDDLSHHVARVGDTYVDFTARQFDPDAPFPKVWVE